MVTSHEMVFTKYYPFDASVSPAYEIVNLTQVIANVLILTLALRKVLYHGMR
jgi:hypothetical protein